MLQGSYILLPEVKITLFFPQKGGLIEVIIHKDQLHITLQQHWSANQFLFTQSSAFDFPAEASMVWKKCFPKFSGWRIIVAGNYIEGSDGTI